MAGAVVLASGTGVAQSAGETTYKANCQMCHGDNGTSDTQMGKALKAKSFSDPEVAKMSDSDLLTVIKNGKSAMPAFKAKLSDDDIKGVIAYIHDLQKKAGADTAGK